MRRPKQEIPSMSRTSVSVIAMLAVALSAPSAMA
jgi:hypothetical protein